MWKTWLAFISILLVLPVVGFVVGTYIGDATCKPDEGFFGGLDCFDRAFRLGALGSIVGLIAGVLLVFGLAGRRGILRP
jgi:hypothetical protein